MLATSSLHACQPQLFIHNYLSGLLERMQQVSLGTQFCDATLLRGKPDEPFAIFVRLMTRGGTRILGPGPRVVQGRCGAGRRGLLKVLALMLRALIVRTG